MGETARVDETGGVDDPPLSADERPIDPTPVHTADLPPTPTRDRDIPATAWVEAPATTGSAPGRRTYVTTDEQRSGPLPAISTTAVVEID
jgi:hypothetical protein